jgi:hypothetical protein
MSPIEWENLASLLSLGTGLIAVVLLLLRLIPDAAIAATERAFHRCSDRPCICGISLPVLSLAACLLITAQKGIPQAEVHDEFSYLLAADTFAHGRITNPTPPFWEHFETPQQLMRPTYMSKYPPGQGIALAIGQLMFGKPIVGAWLSTAAASAAIYWMLLGFLPRSWALLGGIVAAIHPQLLDWSQMYWGGSLTVVGAALVIGAWGRLMIAGPTKAVAAMLAAGLIILANTRPFEGLVLIAPFLIPLAFRMPKHHRNLIIFTGIPLLVTAVAMGYYNLRITGHFWRLPYLEYARQYEIYPKFWFLPPGPMHTYRSSAMEFIHRYFELDAYSQFNSLAAAIFNTRYRLGLLFSTTISLAVLLLPVSAALCTKKEKRLVWITIAVVTSAVAVWTEIFFYPHYLAPLFPAVLLLVIVGWKKVYSWNWRTRPLGRAIAQATFIGFVAGAVMCVYQPAIHDSFMVDQKTVIDELPVLQTGRHLIFVSYAPMHPVHWELVHNLSDLENSRIIWARSLNQDDDQKAAEYFKGRQIWSLYVGGKLDLTRFYPVDSKSK